MGLSLVEDEVAKVPVVGDEYSLFSVGDCQNFGVGKAGTVAVHDEYGVVTEGSKGFY